MIVPVKRAADGRRVLGLPKGHLDGEETPEQAARREVAEETGVDGELLEQLGDVEYATSAGAARSTRWSASSCSATARATWPTTITRSRRRAGCRSSRPREELTYAGEREMVRRAMSRGAADR